MDKRSIILCEKCRHLRVDVRVIKGIERGTKTYSCGLADNLGAWKLWYDRATFEEFEYPSEDCFDRDISEKAPATPSKTKSK